MLEFAPRFRLRRRRCLFRSLVPVAFLILSVICRTSSFVIPSLATRGIGRMPANSDANVNSKKVPLAHRASIAACDVDSTLTNNDVRCSSWIETANAALGRRDLKAAEESLLMAVAEVNGAVMNNPELLRGFENLFRTKIQIALDKNHGDIDTNDEYGIAQDRMGLASLLTDQMKYQEAVDELELAVRSLSKLVATPPLSSSSANGDSVRVGTPDAAAAAAIAADFDQASSLLFRTRAMICDWNDYGESCAGLADSTRRGLKDPDLSTTPAVHPFEALTWPSLSLRDATGVAHAYAVRAMHSNYPPPSTTPPATATRWTTLDERLPRRNVPFVRAVTVTATEDALEPTSSLPRASANTIRVGYLSPDFNGKHPLAFLMQDVFRFHDAATFDIRLYSLGGETDSSPEVQKIVRGGSRTYNGGAAPLRWTTLEGSVPNMARTIRDDRLDVLIDLCGYTGTSLVAEVMASLRGSTEAQSSHDGDGNNSNSHPAVHVAYMGFPGSSGAPFIDYMIADYVVIPSQFRPWYTENILYMPHCYFVNSHKHILPGNPFDDNDNRSCCSSSSSSSNCQHKSRSLMISQRRSEYGLPPDPATFVFCCHSRPDKIDPQTFSTWIRALKRTRKEGAVLGRPDMANAVLWLLRTSDGSETMEVNIRKLAQTIRVNGDSDGDSDDELDESALVFCDHAPRHEHLSRLALSDLFLDTPSYNAHTVGCDCLSAGVPMLSLLRPLHETNNDPDLGVDADFDPFVVKTEKLASRVGASLLRSAEGKGSLILSERLVVSSMKEYEDRMVEFALEKNDDGAVAAGGVPFSSIRDHLRNERKTAPLWDTERWVRNLETGLTEMVDRKRRGAGEADIYVMDFSE